MKRSNSKEEEPDAAVLAKKRLREKNYHVVLYFPKEDRYFDFQKYNIPWIFIRIFYSDIMLNSDDLKDVEELKKNIFISEEFSYHQLAILLCATNNFSNERKAFINEHSELITIPFMENFVNLFLKIKKEEFFMVMVKFARCMGYIKRVDVFMRALYKNAKLASFIEENNFTPGFSLDFLFLCSIIEYHYKDSQPIELSKSLNNNFTPGRVKKLLRAYFSNYECNEKILFNFCSIAVLAILYKEGSLFMEIADELNFDYLDSHKCEERLKRFSFLPNFSSRPFKLLINKIKEAEARAALAML